MRIGPYQALTQPLDQTGDSAPPQVFGWPGSVGSESPPPPRRPGIPPGAGFQIIEPSVLTPSSGQLTVFPDSPVPRAMLRRKRLPMGALGQVSLIIPEDVFTPAVVLLDLTDLDPYSMLIN